MIAAVVDGRLTRATPGARGVCPECKDAVYARVPEHAVRHFAHIPLPDGQARDCTRETGEMSEWHRQWQSLRIDLELIEVTRDQHRADVINAAGIVIEFQNSPISPEDIAKRERYWRRGVWVLNGTPRETGEDRVELRRRPDQPPDDPYRSFRWRKAPALLHRAKWPCWIDVGEKGLLQTRFISDNNVGGGWLATREWFTDEVVNGTKMTLRSHAATKPVERKPGKRSGRVREEAEEDLKEIAVYCTRPRPDEPCCGQRAPGVAGEPIILGCQLCPSSPTYWRGV